jgi:hypothetical protein
MISAATSDLNWKRTIWVIDMLGTSNKINAGTKKYNDTSKAEPIRSFQAKVDRREESRNMLEKEG